METSGAVWTVGGRTRTTAVRTGAGLPQEVSRRAKTIAVRLRAGHLELIIANPLSSLLDPVNPVAAGSEPAPRQPQRDRVVGVRPDRLPPPLARPYALAVGAGDLHPVSTGTTRFFGVKDDGEQQDVRGEGLEGLRAPLAAGAAGVEIDGLRSELRPGERVHLPLKGGHPGREADRDHQQ